MPYVPCVLSSAPMFGLAPPRTWAGGGTWLGCWWRGLGRRRPGGGQHINEKTGGEEARGGERDARAGKVAKDMELGQGNIGGGGGERGGPQPSIDQRN